MTEADILNGYVPDLAEATIVADYYEQFLPDEYYWKVHCCTLDDDVKKEFYPLLNEFINIHIEHERRRGNIESLKSMLPIIEAREELLPRIQELRGRIQRLKNKLNNDVEYDARQLFKEYKFLFNDVALARLNSLSEKGEWVEFLRTMDRTASSLCILEPFPGSLEWKKWQEDQRRKKIWELKYPGTPYREPLWKYLTKDGRRRIHEKELKEERKFYAEKLMARIDSISKRTTCFCSVLYGTYYSNPRR